MRRFVICVAAVLATIASPTLAKAPCPATKYQPPYPWFIEGIMKGDQFADIYLDIDKSGKPINCRMGQNNIPGDDKFFVCKAFIDQWTTAPPSVNPTLGPAPADLPASSPIKGTIHRKYVAYGENHEKAESDARKKFFQQHPEERSECYPRDDD
jgi:hypothetical protein